MKRLLISILLAIPVRLLAQMPGPISVHAPCTWTANNVVGAYSGSLAITAWQYGTIVTNVETGASTFTSGVWRAQLGGCNGRADLVYQGDCHQSVIQLTASNGSPKWLVTPGAPVLCHKDGLMIWRWSAALQKYETVGLAAPPSGSSTFRLGTAILDGDTGWLPLTHDKWSPCDLNTLVCGPAVDSAPPGEGRQANIGGFTYNFGVDFGHAPENGGPVWFWMARSDQPTPTRPPANTPTVTPTGATPTRTPTRDSGCYAFGSANTCTPTPRLSRTATPTRTATPASGRWQVSVTWTKPDGTSGVGMAVPWSSSAWAYWFFSPDNPELYVAVLPSACAINGKIWIKAFAGTNVQVDIAVTDLLTGASWSHHNGPGVMFASVIDTGALPCQTP